jgi:hypothetical protein
MTNWQSHMTPAEAEEYNRAKRGAETFNNLAKRRYATMRKISERCRKRAVAKKGEPAHA